MNMIAVLSITYLLGALVTFNAYAAPSHLADCILLKPLGNVPSNIYNVTDVAPAEGI